MASSDPIRTKLVVTLSTDGSARREQRVHISSDERSRLATMASSDPLRTKTSFDIVDRRLRPSRATGAHQLRRTESPGYNGQRQPASDKTCFHIVDRRLRPSGATGAHQLRRTESSGYNGQRQPASDKN